MTDALSSNWASCTTAHYKHQQFPTKQILNPRNEFVSFMAPTARHKNRHNWFVLHSQNESLSLHGNNCEGKHTSQLCSKKPVRAQCILTLTLASAMGDPVRSPGVKCTLFYLLRRKSAHQSDGAYPGENSQLAERPQNWNNAKHPRHIPGSPLELVCRIQTFLKFSKIVRKNFSSFVSHSYTLPNGTFGAMNGLFKHYTQAPWL